MAKLISVEKSQYINQNIAIYAKNKVGQYSKYLNKNPIFVTYYHINPTASRADVGTGGVESELGESSPLRFNKILNFPVYNLPEMKPDVDYDEAGFDVSLELSDILILPSTLKPLPSSYMIVALPEGREFLFRVNNFRYNTIQANDFYSLDLDFKAVGTNLEETYMKGQVIETYQTIFENIGTEDKCFIRLDLVDQINVLAKTIGELKEIYKETYYQRLTNSFILDENPFSDTVSLYDPYVEEFMIRSNLYYEPGETDALVLVHSDILPPRFELVFRRTLLDAVLRRDIRSLERYCYFYGVAPRKIHSLFIMYRLPVNLITIFQSDKDLYPPEEENPPLPEDPFPEPKPIVSDPQCFCIVRDSAMPEYVPHAFLQQILDGALTSTDLFETIIYNYLHNLQQEIDVPGVIHKFYDITFQNYIYAPIIIYIITQRYNDYFRKEKNTWQL